ncbi:MAG: hypothetical protein AAB600_03895 [Patescibacteria group bacterium]
MKIENLKLKIFLLLFTIYYLLFTPHHYGEGFTVPTINAQTMSNSNYKLKTNIILNPNKDSSNNKASSNNIKPNIFVGPNYKVVSGFQHDPSSSTKQFIFSISQTLIDYGILSATNPVSRTSILSVYNNFTNGYSVAASENHELYNQTSGSTIPNTTCDTGTCSKLYPAPWNNVLTYGFGYRCDNMSDITVCSNDFYDSKYYKQFPNISNSQKPQVLMEGFNIGDNKARITYKINISGTQPIGFYSNTITFVATPNF